MVVLLLFFSVYHLYIGGLLIFFLVDLVSCHITEGIYQLWEFCLKSKTKMRAYVGADME